jgi:hypothetical protein
MTTNFASDTRSYYLRMPRKLHDKAVILSMLSGSTLKDTIIVALTEHLEKQKKQIEAAEKEALS